MVIVDQPEERSILYLKTHDSFIDCTKCTLPKRISTSTTQQNTSTFHSDCSDDEAPRPLCRSSAQNLIGQLTRSEDEMISALLTVAA